jgi:Icc-related predicted phosphoesterase
MKLVCLSDTHTKHKQVPIPDGDVLVHAGDMTGRGHFNEFISVGNWFRALKDKFKYRIFIAGNHDWGLEVDRRAILHNHFDNDVIYLQDQSVVLDGIKFYGTPWMPIFNNWAFMRKEEDLPKYYNNIPDDTEILITHCPPYGILDMESEPRRCGSIALLERVKQLSNLKHHIFGHIHESYGSDIVADIGFHNVCSLNGEYRYQNPPIIIEV